MDGMIIEHFYDFMVDSNKTESNCKIQENEIGLYNQLKELIKHMNVRTFFQPIVSLTDASILGYEALSRGPAGSDLEYPDVLFHIAEHFGRIWDLESLCRSKALSRAKEIFPKHLLFLNVDPQVIYDEKFIRGFTKGYLKRYEMDPENIIFEITEKSSVSDLKSFKKVIDNYTDQGYKIAIDDVGAGYSGLTLLAEVRPQFLKIDMSLIRDVDKDGFKQALVKTLYDFCLATNIKIIAEGIENANELNTLIEIGIQYGQGYFIQRPSEEFGPLDHSIREHILCRQNEKKAAYYENSSTIPIGNIASLRKPIEPEANGAEVLEIFNCSPNVQGIPVVKDEKLQGLIMKDKFFAKLGTQYGVAIFMNRPIDLVMNRNPLVVDYHTPLDKVSQLAMARKEGELYDYVIITNNEKYYGVITIKDLLEKVTELEINYAKHLNPLTGLPGNNLIEKNLKKLINSGEAYCVLYIDLDNFKSYNDVYGFENGDKLIQLTALILKEEAEKNNKNYHFVGHIGGDDFVIITNHYHVDSLCNRIIERFDAKIKTLYKKEDVERGYIITKNRHGQVEEYPLVSISLAGLTNKDRVFSDATELAEASSRIKKTCKLLWQSCYQIDDNLCKTL